MPIFKAIDKTHLYQKWLKSLNHLFLSNLPFHTLEINTSKKGHPYVVDVIVESSSPSSQDEDLFTSSQGGHSSKQHSSFTMVSKNNSLLMVIEVKKSISVNFATNEPSDVIEMLIYSSYLLSIYNQSSSVLGILTDGLTWHCLRLQRSNSNCMKLLKYCRITDKSEELVIGTIPRLLSWWFFHCTFFFLLFPCLCLLLLFSYGYGFFYLCVLSLFFSLIFLICLFVFHCASILFMWFFFSLFVLCA